jgi:hypothetical protein
MTFSHSSFRPGTDSSVLAAKRLASPSLVDFGGSFWGVGATADGAGPVIASASLEADSRDGRALRNSHRIASGLLTNGRSDEGLSGQSLLRSLRTSLFFCCARSALRSVSALRATGNGLKLALCAMVGSLDLAPVNAAALGGQSSVQDERVQISTLQHTVSSLLLGEAQGCPSIRRMGQRDSLVSSRLGTSPIYRDACRVACYPSATCTVIQICPGEKNSLEIAIHHEQLERFCDARDATLIAGRSRGLPVLSVCSEQVSEL